MSYFNLRKRADEPEPEEVEEQEPAAEEEAEQVEERPAKEYGPILTGLFGPARWIAARFGASTALGVHVGSVWAIGYYGGWTAAGVLLAWLLAVLWFVPREHLDRASGWIERRTHGAAEPEGSTVEERPASAPEDVYAATLQWVRSQIGDSNGIHLSELLAHAHAHNLHTDLNVPAFRTVLERWGFTIRQQLKVGGRNRPGIHRDDLPKQPLPSPSPEEGTDAATSAEYAA
jgi:hypothetical protein